MASSIAGKPVFTMPYKTHNVIISPLSPNFALINHSPTSFAVPFRDSSSRSRDLTAAVPKAASTSPPSPSPEDEGIPLGALKLPRNTDLARFEILLFQWGNSLCQSANLPLPVPLKVSFRSSNSEITDSHGDRTQKSISQVDRVPGGARLGFVTIGSNGQPEVDVYIDCLVFPGTDNYGPEFRAIRNGPQKAQIPPAEARIMRSLLEALKKCVEITTTV